RRGGREARKGGRARRRIADPRGDMGPQGGKGQRRVARHTPVAQRKPAHAGLFQELHLSGVDHVALGRRSRNPCSLRLRLLRPSPWASLPATRSTCAWMEVKRVPLWTIG